MTKQNDTPIDCWREIGNGLMICVRLPDGAEVVYMASPKFANYAQLENASKWLALLANGVK